MCSKLVMLSSFWINVTVQPNSVKIPLHVVGSGSYGIVLEADDFKAKRSDPRKVAIKKIEKAFLHRFFAKRTLRELKILRLLKHENVSHILITLDRQSLHSVAPQITLSHGGYVFHHHIKRYLITELLDTDLRGILEKDHSRLEEDHFKLFLYQILRGLKYMHSANILHRDLV